ncbi:hypothetical protein VTJ49DRAFT_2587 [Mycothermus thermophilus]|uniref:non-specific serine/threonine protein kinase n=1 Tax=Humicola insolens TaxID=85995 RepID=A0ABR3VQN7_HUMIN
MVNKPHPPADRASLINLPQDGGGDGLYKIMVDYHRRPFSVTWKGTWKQLPDLSTFPVVDPNVIVQVLPVPLSPALEAIWSTSKLLGFGAAACVRVSDDQDARFPIVKLAHPDEENLKLIENEFKILKDLQTLDVPVPEISTEPIVDDEGKVCGYRMEKLRTLDQSEKPARKGDVLDALKKLHAAGYCHGDVTDWNVMKDGSDRIVLIDFGFAGRVGDVVPTFIPRWVYESGVFTAEIDVKYVKRFFK